MAVNAGAKVTLPIMDAFWGDRYGQVEDPYGHRWSIATRKRVLTEEEIRSAMKAFAAKSKEKSAGGSFFPPLIHLCRNANERVRAESATATRLQPA
jgi:hypothetical protein